LILKKGGDHVIETVSLRRGCELNQFAFERQLPKVLAVIWLTSAMTCSRDDKGSADSVQ
jgi:hypothetical protein